MFKEATEKTMWLNDRKLGIGGSDIGTILGLNAFKSPLQLWMEKTGRLDENFDNNFTRAGVLLEPVVAEWFKKETSLDLVNPGNVVTKHADHEWCLGTPDRIAINHALQTQGIVEIKTTGHSIDPENVPLQWFCQVMWYAGIKKSNGSTQMEENYITWFERVTCQFMYTALKYDPAFFQYLLDQAGEFWMRYVQSDTPPPAKTAQDIQLLYKQHTAGKSVIATSELEEAIADLSAIQKEIKALKDEEEKRKLSIQIVMQDAESILIDGVAAVTWKAAKDSEKFDLESFKSSEPTLYRQYLTTTPGSRRFLIKK